MSLVFLFSCSLLAVRFDWWVNFWCTLEPLFSIQWPDLQIMGAQSSRPWDKGGGGGGLRKNFFRPFRPQFGPKISPRSATGIEGGVFAIAMIYHVGNYSARILGLIWPICMDVCHQEKMALLTIVWINADF